MISPNDGPADRKPNLVFRSTLVASCGLMSVYDCKANDQIRSGV